jgi:hypothetical protein
MSNEGRDLAGMYGFLNLKNGDEILQNAGAIALNLSGQSIVGRLWAQRNEDNEGRRDYTKRREKFGSLSG